MDRVKDGCVEGNDLSRSENSDDEHVSHNSSFDDFGP